MSVLLAILNWLSGSFVGKLFDAWFKSQDVNLEKFKVATGADRDVAIAVVAANVRAQHERNELMKGMWVTQYLIAAALVPPLYHQALVFFDSCPFFLFWTHEQGSWRVAALPGAYANYEWLMISSLLGIQATVTSALSALRLFRK